MTDAFSYYCISVYVFQCLNGKCNRVEHFLWQYIKNSHKYLSNWEIQNEIHSRIVFDLFTKIPEL